MGKRNYSKCEDGKSHDWIFAGGTCTENKTGRVVSDRKCTKCGLAKTVFESTGRRVNR